MHDQLRSTGTGPRAVIVIGVSGSGKSTLGSALARALDCGFLEGDQFHSPEAVARMACGIPLTDEDRWPWLDRLGQAIGAKVAAEGIVVAACSALRRAYRERLRNAGNAEHLRKFKMRRNTKLARPPDGHRGCICRAGPKRSRRKGKQAPGNRC